MEGDKLLQVDVGQSVAVRDDECLVADILPNALDPAAGHRINAGVGERNPIVLFVVVAVVLDLALLSERDSEIIVHRLVAEEVLLERLAFVAQT
jgi:hypothetical protein